jgi:hypothetical protein
MKGTENTRANILSKKLGYEEKQGAKSSFIFRKDKDNFILNKKQLVFITRVDRDLFINKIKSVYDSNIIVGQIP